MKKNTLLVLVLGISFLMSAKCLELFEPGFSARVSDLKVGPKPTHEKAVVKTAKNLTRAQNPLAPTNDNCATATPITSLPYSYLQSDGASASDDGFVLACTNGMNDGVWYTVVGDGTDIKITITPDDFDYDPELGVFTGDCENLVCKGRADDGYPGDSETYTISASVIGTTYYINVGYYSDGDDEPEGNFTIDVESFVSAPNDSCAGAIAIPSTTYSHVQSDGETSTNNDGFITVCPSNGMNDGLWYTVVGDGTFISITVTPENDEFDPKIGVFSGSNCDELECVGTADIGYGGDSETYLIENSVVGTTYYINVGDYSSFSDGPEGNFTIDLTSIIPPDSVPDCASNPSPADEAVDIPVGDIVFTWEAPTTGGPVESYDFYGGIALPLTEDDLIGNYTTTSADITISGYDTVLYWKVVPRNLAGGAEGCTEWSFTTVSPPPPPANDECENAVIIACGDNLTEQTTEAATGGSNTSCVGTIGDDVWYRFSGNGQNIILDIASDGEPAQLEVYESSDGSCGGFSAGECIAAVGTGEDENTLSFASAVGTEYYIHVGSYVFGDPAVNFSLSVSCEDLPDMPDCVSNPFPADNAVDVPIGDIVFTWTEPTTGGPVDSYDFYAGTTTPLTEDDLIDNYTTTSADITLTGYDTLFYWKVVAKNVAGDAIGCAEWSFTTVPAPPIPVNDECSTATAITTFPFTDALDAAGATNNDGYITTCTNAMNDGIWYTVVGNGSDITIDATSGNWDGQLGVYTGSCGNFTCYQTVDAGFEGDTETITISNSVQGTTYYVNFGHYNGTSDQPEGLVSIEVTTTALGIDGNEFKNFIAYPNPVKNILNLSYTQNITGVEVYNLLGQQVIVKAIDANQSQIDMSGLSAGSYLVKVMADNAVKTIKVIKE